MGYSVGDRVGVVASIKDGIAEIFGYGVYMGELVPEYEGDRGTMADFVKDLGRTNPTIKLDSGEMVYGCECWWGSEEAVKNRLAQCKEVKIISIAEYLKEAETAN